MPMPTIPGVLPETWEQILQILAQLNTSVVELGEQGITTFEQLRQWLTLQGYELVEISEVVGYTIAKTDAVDPATTNAVANRVATDIVATGGAGTAVTQFVTGGNRTLGLVPKVVAVGACLSMLVSFIGAGLVSDENEEDLVTSVDPYTIDGENVPVLIDENGKTHFLEEMVEAIRAKAIELGVFDTEMQPPSVGSGYGYAQVGTTTETTLGPVNTANFVAINPYQYKQPYLEFTGVNGHTYEAGICFISSSGNIVRSRPSGNIYGYKYYDQVTGRYTIRFWTTENYNDLLEGYANLGYYVRDLTTDPTDWRGYYSVLNTKSYQYNVRNMLTDEIRTSPAVANNMENNIYYFGGTPYFDDSWQRVQTGGTDYDNWISMYHLQLWLTYAIEGGEGVEGITPAQDLITAGVADVTKPLTEVLPQLATGQMSIASPTENDLTHKSNWYPVSINSEDVFTDGATEEETSAAPDGDVKQDLQPAILDAINELIEQLNPDGTPDITVSDSGDTPPENPPLTPSAGTDGSNGLWAIYNPTLAQVQQFGAWLWSDTLADQFKRIFNSPIDGVIGFHMLYCTPSRGADQTIKCGFLASQVTSRTVASPYVEIDCGTVSIGEFYRNALDYDYTRISVYLPFIGIVPLDTNIVMGSDLNITYRVDVLTGTCLAQIKVIKENSDAVMYAFEGNCAVQIPLTATTYTGMVGALMSGVSAGIGVMTGNIAQAVTSGANAFANMVSGKSGVKQSGTMGANAGALGIRKPYVIITHPIEYMPVNFNKLEGLPSNITATLGALTGFTRVRSVHLENIGTATQEEINMIEELLKEGVII